MARRWYAGVLVLAGMLAAPAQAWNGFSHRLVAELALEQLSDPARAQWDALLAQEPGADPGTVARWADTVREQPAYRHTARLHYVNFPRGQCRFDRARDCPEGACIVAGIEHYSAMLADPQRPAGERLEALKFVVHLVADVHQPLHAGHFDDRGGNRFQISLEGQGSNLHAVWDRQILASAGLRARQYRERLAPHVAAAQPGPLDAARWAEESCALIESAGIYPKRPGQLPSDYLEQRRALAEQRIVLAAARLATVLEQALTAAAGKEPERNP